jgi:hypothetical protein
VRQAIIEMEAAFLFIMAAGEGVCLAVLSSAEANVSVMAYEMAMLVRRMGPHLTAPSRFPDHEAAAGLSAVLPRGQVAGPGCRTGGAAICGGQGRTMPAGALASA